jgi:hypothetical protein
VSPSFRDQRFGALTGLKEAHRRGERPVWFASAVSGVLRDADAVLTADGPWELENVVAELLGGQLDATVAAGHHDLWFAWWFEELAMAAATAADGDPRVGWRLLNGLASLCAAAAVPAVVDLARPLAGRVTDAPWLITAHEVDATGDVWLARDVYACRFGVVASFTRPGEPAPAFVLFDVDAARLVTLANTGMFPDVDVAMAAWRRLAGDSAADAVAHPLADTSELDCLVRCALPERVPDGTESGATLREWFRAGRRYEDLAAALAQRGTPLPRRAAEPEDVSTLVTEFVDWFVLAHGEPPELEAVDALAEDWLQDALPGTEHSTPPERVRFTRELIGDWLPDDPVTLAAIALLPDWVRWHNEVTGLPENFARQALDVATD